MFFLYRTKDLYRTKEMFLMYHNVSKDQVFSVKSLATKEQFSLESLIEAYDRGEDIAPLLRTGLSQGALAALNTLLELLYRYDSIRPSQSFIGLHSNGRNKKYGMSRRWTNHLIKMLCAYGFITKKRRYDTTCVYTVSDFFLQDCIRYKICHLLPALLKFKAFGKNVAQRLVSNFSSNIGTIFNKATEAIGIINSMTRRAGEKHPLTIQKPLSYPKKEPESMNRSELLQKARQGLAIDELLPLLPEEIKAIDVLQPLTPHGMIKLAAYDESVLKAVLARFMKERSTIGCGKKWLSFMVKTISNDLNIKPSWPWYFDMKRALSFGDNEAVYDDTRMPMIVKRSEKTTETRTMPAHYAEKSKLLDKITDEWKNAGCPGSLFEFRKMYLSKMHETQL